MEAVCTPFGDCDPKEAAVRVQELQIVKTKGRKNIQARTGPPEEPYSSKGKVYTDIISLAAIWGANVIPRPPDYPELCSS